MYKKQKRIPTLLGIFLIVLGIGILSFGSQEITSLTTLADPAQKPESITITNVTDSSFSVSWTTEKETQGVILTKDGSLPLAFLDDSDTDGISRSRILHHITLKRLKESTLYISQIQTGKIVCSQFSVCPSLSQVTLPKPTKTSGEGPVYGTVLNKDNKPLAGALVYLTINNKVSFSTKSDSLGKWVIPLVVTGKENAESLTGNDQILITVLDAPRSSGTISLDGNILHANREIPPIKIGISQTLKLSQNTFAFLTKNKQNTNVLGSTTDTILKVEIYFPKKDNDTTIDPRPRIRGIGIPGIPLTLTIPSTSQMGRVVPDIDGKWEWRPPKSLSPGVYTIIAESYNSQKQMTTLSRKFFVLKSGESVLGDATPSASLTPSPTSSIVTGTPTPTISIVLTPTLTLTPTLKPSNTPTPTLIVNKPDAPGGILPTVALITSGIGLLAIGAKLLLFP